MEYIFVCPTCGLEMNKRISIGGYPVLRCKSDNREHSIFYFPEKDESSIFYFPEKDDFFLN